MKSTKNSERWSIEEEKNNSNTFTKPIDKTPHICYTYYIRMRKGDKMDKQEIEKIKTQIEKSQKYLLSFSGNERKTYAVKQRIFKLKDKIGDTSPTYQLGPYGPFVSR